MFYEEAWIEGKLMYRTSPTGTWYVCTTEQLYRRIHELQTHVADLVYAAYK